MNSLLSLRSRPMHAALATLVGLALTACEDHSLPTTPAPAAALADGGSESLLFAQPAAQFGPAISGDVVVYGDLRNGNYDVYAFDIATRVETPVGVGTGTQQHPDVSGDWAVYEDSRSTLEVRARNLVTGEDFQASPSVTSAAESEPAVSDSNLVYVTNRASNYDIYLYNLNSRTERPLTTSRASSTRPAVSGSYVVWQEHLDGTGDDDIMLYDLRSNVSTKITQSLAFQTNPAIDGDRVVFEDNRNGNTEIYLYEISTGNTFRITSNAARQRNPRISGDLVTWEDNRHGDSNAEVYAFDLSTCTERRITTSTANQFMPRVSGARIVWQDNRNASPDVYMYTVAGTVAAGGSGPITCMAPVPG